MCGSLLCDVVPIDETPTPPTMQVITTGGYREAVTLPQIKTNMEMDSHEEKLALMIKQSKMDSAKDQAARQAKAIRERQRELVRASHVPCMDGWGLLVYMVQCFDVRGLPGCASVVLAVHNQPTHPPPNPENQQTGRPAWRGPERVPGHRRRRGLHGRGQRLRRGRRMYVGGVFDLGCGVVGGMSFVCCIVCVAVQRIVR